MVDAWWRCVACAAVFAESSCTGGGGGAQDLGVVFDGRLLQTLDTLMVEVWVCVFRDTTTPVVELIVLNQEVLSSRTGGSYCYSSVYLVFDPPPQRKHGGFFKHGPNTPHW